jgi:choline-sulfatase
MARHVLGEEAAVVPSPSEEPTPGFPPTIETAMLPELPPNHYDADFTSRPRSVQYQCCAHNRLAQTQGWGEREFRLYLDAYNHYIHLVDREIARIMERATACLDMSQTFVVFTSDHGDAITAHSGATKHTTFYEETTRVPFAVTGPGIAPGARVGGVASLLDLVPTLLDLADITAGADAEAERARSALSLMDGQSQAGPLTSGRRLARAAGEGSRYVVSEWHTEWGFTIEPGRMITDGRYKLMRYAEGDEEEFYDLAADPYETRNLLGKEASDSPSGLTAPGNAESLGRLREELKRHLRNSGDPFEDLEPSIDPRWRSHEPGYHKHRGIAAPQADRP